MSEDNGSSILLEINNLAVEYHSPEGIVKAIDGVSLNVKEKKTLAIVGESGSGKSTLAYSIVRLLPNNAYIVRGSILFHYRKIDLAKASEEEIRKIRGKDIGLVFQDPMTFLNPVMRIDDQIAEVITTHTTLTKKQARMKAIELLKKLKIPNAEAVATSYPHQLSGGMRQRVVIAIAIANNPKLLIADEPTSALDVTIQAEILELFKNLQKDLGLTLILITHDLGVAAKISDEVAIMYAGKIAEIGDVYSIYKDPQHPYTMGLLESVLTISNEKPSKKILLKGNPPNLINPPSGCRFHPRCPLAMERCKKEEPPLMKINNRYVACWLVSQQ